MSELYKQIPKEMEANLRYRLALRQRAANDAAFRRAMITACKHDVLFFFNAWCWLYEPRPKVVNGRKLPNVIPFITWAHQDPVILELDKHLGHEDIGAEKSRGEGMSWIAILKALQEWLFHDLSAIGLVSRTELAVDNQDDPDSLFWKLDWELSKLPRWMAGVKDKDYKRSIAEHTLKNYKNGSTITGYSATGDVASGGRKKWFLMDELAKFPRGDDREAMASTQHVTNSRLVVSTPKGSEGAYYELMHEPSSMVKLVLDWKDNPTRNRGLYELIDNKPVAVDPVGNPLPPQYSPPDKDISDLFSRLRKKGFKLEGRQRSPWYDHECDRPGATPQNIAQELDRDYGGSMHRLFGNDFMAAAEPGVKPPSVRGQLTYHPETLEPEFEEVDNGPLLLWLSLDHRKRPPARQYCLGADVAAGLAGSYSSNSSVTVIDQTTMEQVAELASNSILPADFADLCIALAKWFWDGYLAWEGNGPGSAFTKRVLDQQYGNVFYRTIMWKRGKNKKTKELGWWTDPRSKEAMFEELGRSVRQKELVLRSDQLVKEFGQYVRLNGKIEHILAVNTQDDSSSGQAHGDRVISCGVCLMAVRDRPLASGGLSAWLKENPPPGTMASRQKEYEDGQKKGGSDWDDRTNFDLAASDHAGLFGGASSWN